MERDFEIGGKQFRLSKINALKQFHVVRRIAPILAKLAPIMAEAAANQGKIDALPEAEKLKEFAKFASPIMEGLSELSDQDSEFVLMSLLGSAEIQQSAGNWAKIANGTMLMIQDLELPVMLNVAGRALMYNLSGFFAVLPQVS